jgi:hypothetical protein
MEKTKKMFILAMALGALVITEGLTNPPEGENLSVMAGLGLMAWATILYKVETKKA